MNRKIALLFLCIGIAILPGVILVPYLNIKLPPLFLLFFAVFVFWGSAAELAFVFYKKKRAYYLIYFTSVFGTLFYVIMYKNSSVEEINSQIESWTLGALSLFMISLAVNFIIRDNNKN